MPDSDAAAGPALNAAGHLGHLAPPGGAMVVGTGCQTQGATLPKGWSITANHCPAGYHPAKESRVVRPGPEAPPVGEATTG